MKKGLFTFFIILVISVLVLFLLKTKYGIGFSDEFFLTDNTIWQGLIAGGTIFAFWSLFKVFSRFFSANIR